VATRITRKELKTDKFAMEVGQTVDFVSEHRRQLVTYGSIALAVVAIAAAGYFYLRHQQTARQQSLAEAIQVQESPVGPPNPGALMSFTTEDAKRDAAIKAFSAISSKYPGSSEGTIAKYYLGAIAADQGKMADAEKLFKEAADARDKDYASLARLSLAQVYFGEKRTADAEKILRDLMNHPTIFVSKEQATVALAKGIAATKPAEARKLLEPLRTQPGAISQVAINAAAEISGQ
jgi:predicted negative regulator of RcsB-dependent stress response